MSRSVQGDQYAVELGYALSPLDRYMFGLLVQRIGYMLGLLPSFLSIGDLSFILLVSFMLLVHLGCVPFCFLLKLIYLQKKRKEIRNLCFFV